MIVAELSHRFTLYDHLTAHVSCTCLTFGCCRIRILQNLQKLTLKDGHKYRNNNNKIIISTETNFLNLVNNDSDFFIINKTFRITSRISEAAKLADNGHLFAVPICDRQHYT